MTESRPFTKDTLLKYPDFVSLPAELKDSLVLLEGRLSGTGDPKRTPNPFFVYRRERSTQITSQHKATHDPNATDYLPQKGDLLQMQDELKQLLMGAKRAYQLPATATDEDIHKFPYYKYTPINNSCWEVLDSDAGGLA